MNRVFGLLIGFSTIIIRLLYSVYQCCLMSLGFVFGLFNKKIFYFLMKLSRTELNDLTKHENLSKRTKEIDKRINDDDSHHAAIKGVFDSQRG